LTLELLFKVSPGLNWEDASVHLLVKEVLGPLCSMSILEEGEGPEDFFLIAGKLLQGQAQIQHAGVEEGSSRTLFAGEVWGRGEGGLTREEDTGIGGRAMVGAGAGLVISWVICCI